MYEEFYGLEAKPFHLSPDPRFFFESRGHSRALAYLHYGVEQGDGFVVVTGDVGTGKTTLARLLYEELRRSKKVVAARIVVTQCTSDQLLRMIAEAFGVAQERRSMATVLKDLEKYLQQQHDADKRTLLLLDEVQNLPMDALEMLRMLSNFQSEERPLLQSLLLGQAEFQEILQARGAEQLRQRVIASCHLYPLASAEETRSYVEHRLKHVGWDDDPHIDEDAYPIIQDFTSGVPRRINTFCDRLMLFSYLEELHHIKAETVEAVAEEISSDFPVRDTWRAQSSAPSAVVADVEQAARLADLEERVHALEEALRSTRDSLSKAFATRPEAAAAPAARAAGGERS
jgi:putative secretion ATPase (PEP-CTERM system associated)